MVTEELTQSVLSVKTLSKPLPNITESRKTITSRWLKSPKDPEQDSAASTLSDPTCPTVIKIAGEIEDNGVAAELDRGFSQVGAPKPPLPDWLKWLGEPHTLLGLLSDVKELLLPLNDLRVRPFVTAIAGVPDDKEPAEKTPFWLL